MSLLRLRHKELRSTQLITKDGPVAVDKDGYLDVSEAAAAHLLRADPLFRVGDSAAEIGVLLAAKKTEMKELMKRGEALDKEIRALEEKASAAPPTLVPDRPTTIELPAEPITPPAPPVEEPPSGLQVINEESDELDVDAEDEGGNVKPFASSLESKIDKKKAPVKKGKK